MHMAFAAAYAQGGVYYSSLRVYRLLLKSPYITAFVLDVIGEDLDALEGVAAPVPRFHLVRGDLYMKQHRYNEAIEEYNKIQPLQANGPSWLDGPANPTSGAPLNTAKSNGTD